MNEFWQSVATDILSGEMEGVRLVQLQKHLRIMVHELDVVLPSQEVDDLVQETIGKLCRGGASTLKTATCPHNYAKKVLRNAAADWFRTRKRTSNAYRNYGKEVRCRPGLGLSPTEGNELFTTESPVEDALRAERVLVMREAIQELRCDERALLESFYFKGIPASQIARELDVPPSRVWQRLKTARDNLGRLFSRRMA